MRMGAAQNGPYGVNIIILPGLHQQATGVQWWDKTGDTGNQYGFHFQTTNPTIRPQISINQIQVHSNVVKAYNLR